MEKELELFMEFTSTIAPGMTHEVQDSVTEEKTARVVGSGSLNVYATPCMAALMERAAAELCQRECHVGWTTVGTALSISHRAATPVGLSVRAVAEVTAVDGRKINLKVTAYDAREEIGSGTHERFAVASEKFFAKAESKR